MISSFLARIHRCAVFFTAIVVFWGTLDVPTLKAASNPVYKPIIEERIQRIQENLLAAVSVKGETAQISSLADRMSEMHVPGISIAVIHDGKIDWARGFGVVKKDGLPVTPETLFQAASISKPVTAMAVLHLAESGKVDLDSDVNQYLKSWKIPDNEFVEQSMVTIRKLLSHTAGMTVHGFAGYAPGDPVPSLINVLNGEPPANSLPIIVDTMPGKIMRYSGGGYVVIQQMLKDVTGKSFPELMRETVLEPIGMSHSTFEQPLSQERLLEAAMPYSSDGEAIAGGPHVYPEMSAAGLWTTPSDLARFAIELQETLSRTSKHILSVEMVRNMLNPVLNNYGLGLSVGGSTEEKYFTHGGANAGFQCNLVAYNAGDGAVIMTNSNNGGQLASEILRTIAYEYGWPDFLPVEQNEITVAPESLEQFVGTYQLTPGFNLMITLEGGQLMAQASGQGKAPLFASAETQFFCKVVDAQIDFKKDESGKVTGLTLHQNGKDIDGPRISDTVVERKEIQLPSGILEQYVGTYELQSGVDITITLEGGQLFTQVTGQQKFPLFPESENKFFLKIVDSQHEYIKDDNGVVTHVIIRQGPVEIEALRENIGVTH